MNPEKFKVPGQVGESKITVLDKQYDWGIYFWKKANGKPFTDGNGSVLNIPSHRGVRAMDHTSLCLVLPEYLKKNTQNRRIEWLKGLFQT
jgi:hypothetical protein